MGAHRPRRRSRRWVGHLLSRMHRWIFRRTSGRVGGRVVGMPVLLLTTTGRRSGRPHTVPLNYFPSGPDFVVIASNGGARRHPQWYANLRVHPEASVQLPGRRLRTRAREATVEERSRFWAQAVEAYRGYATYQARTRRRIPVVVLQRERAESGKTERP